MDRTTTLLLLFHLLALASGQQGATSVPCLTSRADCSAGISSVSVINNRYFCCSAGYSMAWLNGVCSCRQTSEVVPCGVGPQVCRNANSISSDGSGNTRCCHGGYSMSSFNGFINGQYINSCSCSRPLNGFGGGAGVFVSNGVDPNFNQTEFQARMRQWEQRFRNQMQTMQANLQRNLGNMFRRLGING